jgi:copper chaperone
MVTFRVSDMNCGHCASSIARAIASVDNALRVEVSVPEKLVRVSGNADANDLANAITQAGYTPQTVGQTAPPANQGGCCCAAKRTPPVARTQSGCCG